MKERANAELETAMGGKYVFYGQNVQLFHFGTGSFLSVRADEAAEVERNALRMALLPEPDNSCYFSVLPRFKVRILGEKVFDGDVIVFNHTETAKNMHLSERRYASEAHELEVNGDDIVTGWKLSQFAAFTADADKIVSVGDVVRLFHQESEGYFGAAATPLFGRHHVFLKRANASLLTHKEHSSNTLWQIELLNVSEKGGPLTWNTNYRLKHLGSGKHL